MPNGNTTRRVRGIAARGTVGITVYERRGDGEPDVVARALHSRHGRLEAARVIPAGIRNRVRIPPPCRRVTSGNVVGFQNPAFADLVDCWFNSHQASLSAIDGPSSRRPRTAPLTGGRRCHGDTDRADGADQGGSVRARDHSSRNDRRDGGTAARDATARREPFPLVIRLVG